MNKTEFDKRFESIRQDFNTNEVKSALKKMDLSGKDPKEQLAELFNSYLELNQRFVKTVFESLFLDND